MIHPFPFFRSFAFVRQNYKPTVSAASWYPNSHNYTIDFVSHNAGCWVYFKWPHFKWNRSCFFSSLSASCIIYTSWINFIWKTENCGCCIMTRWAVRALHCQIFLCATYVFSLFFCIIFYKILSLCSYCSLTRMFQMHFVAKRQFP